MNVDRIRTIAVIGSGTMGSQIAQQCALYGYSVCMMDSDPAQLERGLSANRAQLQRRVDRGKLTAEQMESALELVRVTRSSRRRRRPTSSSKLLWSSSSPNA